MIEQFLAFVVVPLACYLFGQWVGVRSERSAWTKAAFGAPEDHVRCRGRDYLVMSLDRFYRDFYNPLAGLRFADAHRASKARDGCGVSASERASAFPNPDPAKGTTP